jgi:hypothetical protein
MDNRSTRPVTFWLTQTVLAAFTLLLICLAAFDGVLLRGFHRGGADASLVVLGVVIPLGFALLPSLACWGLAGRRSFGRWLGLLSLSLLWALLLLAQASRAPGLLLYYGHSWPALAAAVGVCVLINGLFLFLIVSLARSK